MKNTNRFAVFLLSTALMAAPAFAAPKIAVPQADSDSAKAAVAKPMSAWLVGPSQASAFDAKDHPEEQGCLMVTEFDNGMIIGIHAREQGIVGMTVDTKVQDMQPGEMRSVGLNVGQNAYMMNAMATDASTLALNLDEADGGKEVVERLTGLGNFRLLINEEPHYFATTGFTDGLARLQACMGSTMAVPVVVTGPGDTTGKVKHRPMFESMKVTSSGHETPLALAMPNLVPTGYKFVLEDVDPMTPINWQAGDDWVDVMRRALEPHDLKMVVKDDTIRILQRTGDADPVIEDTQLAMDEPAAVEAASLADVPEGVWGGAKGESLSSVLEAWGLMAGVNVKVDLTKDLTLPRDVRYEGRFDEAVQRLLGQFSGRDKPQGAFRGMNTEPVTSARSTSARAPRAPRADVRGVEVGGIETPASTWRPRPVSEIKKVDRTWQPLGLNTDAPLKQMRTIPDPPGAPKVVDKDGKAVTSAAAKSGKSASKWEALAGTSLRDALEHWGSEAGVAIVWMSSENYPLQKTIRSSGKFEDVVMEALDQYKGQGARPVAQLNQDPKTGEKALIIKTQRL